MKNNIIIGVIAFLLVLSIIILVNKKAKPSSTGLTSTSESKNPKDLFKNLTDLCTVLTKEEVSSLLGKPVLKTNPVTTDTIHSCQYYLTDNEAVILNVDYANVEDQKNANEYLGWKIVTYSQIPMENFSVIQGNGLINRLFLVLSPNEYLSINRTSGKTISEDEMIALAVKLAGVVTGKTPLSKSNSLPTPTVKAEVPLPQESDIVRNFFNLIAEKKPSDAVSMMNVSDDSQKQAWTVQFNAFSSMKVTSIEPSMQTDWTDTKHTYKVTLNVTMNPDSASAPIPYYGWDNGQNVRWIPLEKVGNLWKINGIATGP